MATPSKFKFTTNHYVEMKTDGVMSKHRHSGQRITSSGNYLVEMVSTLVAIFSRPTDIIDQLIGEREGQPRPMDQAEFVGDRGPVGRYGARRAKLPRESTRYEPPINVTTRFAFEGDDGLVKINMNLNDKPDMKLIESKYHDLGLDVKLFLVKDGIVNFCGVNYLVQNGRTVKGACCPDPFRALGKIGICENIEKASNPKNKAYEICISWLARAKEFAGRCDMLATMFKNNALSLAKKYELSHTQEAHVSRDLYYSVGKSALKIGDLVQSIDSYMSNGYLTKEQQAKLLLLSMKQDDGEPYMTDTLINIHKTMDEMIMVENTDISGYDDSSAYNIMPECVKRKITECPCKVIDRARTKSETGVAEITDATRNPGVEPLELALQLAVPNELKAKGHYPSVSPGEPYIPEIEALLHSTIYDEEIIGRRPSHRLEGGITLNGESTNYEESQQIATTAQEETGRGDTTPQAT